METAANLCKLSRDFNTRRKLKLKLREREHSLPRVFFAKLTKLDGKKKLRFEKREIRYRGNFTFFFFFLITFY